jgi:hypothetical protein
MLFFTGRPRIPAESYQFWQYNNSFPYKKKRDNRHGLSLQIILILELDGNPAPG